MTTKVYARAPRKILSHTPYVTPGKLYPILSEAAGGFDMIDDVGDYISCIWTDCAHFEGRHHWERVEIDEPEYIGSRYNRLTVIEQEADLAALEVALQAQRAQEALEAIDGELL